MFLRHGGKKYRKSYADRPVAIRNRASINERPNDGYGNSVGDMETGVIVCKDGKGAIVTLVDKYSSFLMMRKFDAG